MPWRVRIMSWDISIINVVRVKPVITPIIDVGINIIHNIIKCTLITNYMIMIQRLPCKCNSPFVCLAFHCAFDLTDHYGKTTVMMEIL